MDTKTIINNVLSNKVNNIIFLCITVLLSNIFLALTPFCIGSLINVLLKTEINVEAVIWMCIFSGISLLLKLLFEYISLNQSYKLGDTITTTLQKEAYASIIKAEISQLDKVDPKYLSNCLNKDCTKIGKEYVSKNIVKFCTNLSYLIIVFIFMLMISPIMGYISLAFVPIYCLSVTSSRKLFKNNQTNVDYIKVEENKIIEENISLLKEIKMKNGVTKEIKDYTNWFERNEKKFKYNYILNQLNSGLIRTIVVSIFLIVVTAVGVSLVINNTLSLGNCVSCAIYIPYIYQAVLKVMDIKISSSTISNEIYNLDQIFKLRSETRSEPINQIDELSEVKFSNVCYDDGENVIKDLSFDLRSNEKLGILCLDNTSPDLIQQLFIKMKKPRSGTISFNDCDANKINTYYLRDLVSTVGCNEGLFDDSIINNVTYPFPFDEYKYNDSLYKARLKDTIFDLENKDATLVNDLSDEVREQVSIANAFYKDAKLFVFNTITKNLNPQLSEEIQKEIFKLKNKLIVMITDKGRDITGCDKVIILKNGEIVETGNVQELLKNRESVFYTTVRKIRLRSRALS